MKTGYQVADLLTYVTGLMNQELLLQIEYLAAETESFGRTRQAVCASPMLNAPLLPS